MELAAGLLGSILFALVVALVMVAIGYVSGRQSNADVGRISKACGVPCLIILGCWVFGPWYLEGANPTLSAIAIGLARTLSLGILGLLIGYALGDGFTQRQRPPR